MSQKWNLQDIRPSGSNKQKPPRPQSGVQSEQIHQNTSAEQKKKPERFPTIDVIDGKKARRKRLFVSILLGIIILVIGFFVSTLLRGADIFVYPKLKDVNVQADFTAYKEPAAGDLSFELLTIEATGERRVSATGQEEVSERSEGNIFIYNEFSESPQRLIKNTRFESPEGLVFRVSESIEVPGMTKEAGGKIVPGVVTAKVFADGTGDQYNIAPSRFTIPGLEGTDQFERMYAESTEKFTGGFEGTKFIIEDAELQTAQQSLHLELRDALLSRLESEKPAGFILYDGGITFAYDSLPSTGYSDELATIKEKARLQVPIFKATEFASYLAEHTVAGYENESVYLTDPYTLKFSYTSPTTTVSDIATLTEIPFTLVGNTRIVWAYDEEKLKSELVGLSKTALSSVLSGYPAIERAEAEVRPFWNQSFPDNQDEIAITTRLGDNAQ